MGMGPVEIARNLGVDGEDVQEIRVERRRWILTRAFQSIIVIVSAVAGSILGAGSGVLNDYGGYPFVPIAATAVARPRPKLWSWLITWVIAVLAFMVLYGLASAANPDQGIVTKYGVHVPPIADQ